jgi:hypothetical protein
MLQRLAGFNINRLKSAGNLRKKAGDGLNAAAGGDEELKIKLYFPDWSFK